MKLLIIETTAEGQSEYTRRIHEFGPAELEMLDLNLFLAGENDFEQQVGDKDIAILGQGLGERALAIARKAKAINPELKLILFAAGELYSAAGFRAAYSAGIHKVLSAKTSNLDFLQELLAILDGLRRRGVVNDGQIVYISQAKGGVGATTIAAALAEVSAGAGRKTLAWDFDIDTADLSRSLLRGDCPQTLISNWLEGNMDLNRETLRQAVVPIADHLDLLPPPRNSMAESFDLVCHTNGINVCCRIGYLAQTIFDTVVVDTAGRLGPATGAMLASANRIVVVIDDTVLGLTGLRSYIELIKPALADISCLRFLVNGSAKISLAIREMRESLDVLHELPEEVWELRPIPFDPNGANWAATGKSLYACASRDTRTELERCARQLGLI